MSWSGVMMRLGGSIHREKMQNVPEIKGMCYSKGYAIISSLRIISQKHSHINMVWFLF